MAAAADPLETITVRSSVKTRLRALGKQDENFNTIIKRLLDLHDLRKYLGEQISVAE